MKRATQYIFATVLLASCTAINQKDGFLDTLSGKTPVTVFSENFENGLGNWTQSAGTWTTTTPAIDGVALRSPTSATPANFSISTKNNIPFTGSGCVMEYNILYSLAAASGVSANILIGSNVVASFKQSSGTSAISSSAAFVPKKIYLPAGTAGMLTIATSVTATGAADLSIDNITITCNNSVGPGVTLIADNFETSASNWTLPGPWTYSATNGASNSKSLYVPSSHCVNASAVYSTNISLVGRHGCKIRYYYSLSVGDATSTLNFEWNGLKLDTKLGTNGATYVEYFVSAFDGAATNSLQFHCIDGCSAGGTLSSCAVDEVTLTCAQ